MNKDTDLDQSRAAILQLDNVRKVYRTDGGVEHVVLQGVTINFQAGTFTAIMGPSGSGKSTLLNSAAGLDQPTSGSVTVSGTSLASLSASQLAVFRREHIGFIFQLFNLLPALTVRENISLPLRLMQKTIDENALTQVIEQVGLGEKQNSRPHQLSGGQQQRVAIARALFSKPTILFADEPTGALDTKTSKSILDLLSHAVKDSGQTVVMVTHDPIAAAHADRVIFIADGSVAGELLKPTAEKVAERMLRLTSSAHNPTKAR